MSAPDNFGMRAKKLKRVSDVNAMGYTAPVQPNIYPNVPNEPQYNFQEGFVNPTPPLNVPPYGSANIQNVPPQNTYEPLPEPTFGAQNAFPMSPNLTVLREPIVQDMAMQYGQQLAGAGSTIIKEKVGQYVPVGKLKYYFAVDTRYVLSKLLLLFFPFTHSDWSVKYEQNEPIQPRYEINAPDLYIPTMSYITYVLVAGLMLGLQDRFTPEQIGIRGSSAMAWCLVELIIYNLILYIMQVKTNLGAFDILAYLGYKFVGIITSILTSVIGGKIGFYTTLIYTNFALAFFLIRSLKVQVLSENSSDNNSYYDSTANVGHKRKLYFLLFVAVIQSILSYWLSYNLIPTYEQKKILD